MMGYCRHSSSAPPLWHGPRSCGKASTMSNDRSERTPATTSRAEIDTFLSRVKVLGPITAAGTRGRLIFALDATMSRQPTWDQACMLQADMFREAAVVGGLDIQLVYYRGLAECRASPWIAEPER